jgi:peptidoglycan biosynthesis protein MviN/MurJ (putative lipid II flippase)
MCEIGIAAGEFRPWTIYNAIAMILVIAGDFILIPSYGAAGAMFSKLTSISIGCGILIYLQRHAQYLDAKEAIVSLVRVLFSVLTALIISFILSTLHWNAWIEGGIILLVFFSMIHTTRVISLHDTVGFAKRIRGNQELEV